MRYYFITLIVLFSIESKAQQLLPARTASQVNEKATVLPEEKPASLLGTTIKPGEPDKVPEKTKGKEEQLKAEEIKETPESTERKLAPSAGKP